MTGIDNEIFMKNCQCIHIHTFVCLTVNMYSSTGNEKLLCSEKHAIRLEEF